MPETVTKVCLVHKMSANQHKAFRQTATDTKQRQAPCMLSGLASTSKMQQRHPINCACTGGMYVFTKTACPARGRERSRRGKQTILPRNESPQQVSEQYIRAHQVKRKYCAYKRKTMVSLLCMRIERTMSKSDSRLTAYCQRMSSLKSTCKITSLSNSITHECVQRDNHSEEQEQALSQKHHKTEEILNRVCRCG